MSKVNQSSSKSASKSQEYVVDSSSDDEEEVEDEVEEREEEEETSPSQDGSESQNTTPSKLHPGSSPSGSDNEAPSESTSSSGSSSSSGTKRKSKSTASVSETAAKKSKINPRNSKSNGESVIQPLPGFSPIELGASDFVSETGNMFSRLDGRQVWHITAPSSIPITSVEELDIQAVLRGEPILQHGHTRFSMFAVPSQGEVLLLPQGHDSVYSQAKVDISRTLHLRETFDTSSEKTHKMESDMDVDQVEADRTTQESQFCAADIGTKKPHREQPSGLLMRYQPYGAANAQIVPYQLPNPGAEDDQEDEVSVNNRLYVPAEEVDMASHTQAITPKKTGEERHSKNKKTPKGKDIHQETPRSKLNSKSSSSMPQSEQKKKRRKDGSEKA